MVVECNLANINRKTVQSTATLFLYFYTSMYFKASETKTTPSPSNVKYEEVFQQFLYKLRNISSTMWMNNIFDE